MANQFYYDSVYFNGSDITGAAAELYQPKAEMSLDTDGMLYGSMWLDVNGQVIKSGLGEASFRIFDRDGNILGWIGENNIVANAEGQFLITPISANALTAYQHYLIEVTISYGGQDRVAYVGASVTS